MLHKMSRRGDIMADIDRFISGIKMLINDAVSKAPYDRTFLGIITAVNADGTYDVKIDGKVLQNTPAVGSGTLSVNNAVRVVFPQNNSNLRFILR